MKRIWITLLALVMCMSVLTGCGDPVQEDLINYINNQVPTLVALEDKVSQEYESAVKEKNGDDAKLAAKLKDVIIPASDELLAKARAIVPATEEVKKVHNKYIAAYTEQHEAFTLLLQAAQNNNETLVNTVSEKLVKADTLSKEFLADIETLKKEHQVVETAK